MEEEGTGRRCRRRRRTRRQVPEEEEVERTERAVPGDEDEVRGGGSRAIAAPTAGAEGSTSVSA